jgi:hypothetical protein
VAQPEAGWGGGEMLAGGGGGGEGGRQQNCNRESISIMRRDPCECKSS